MNELAVAALVYLAAMILVSGAVERSIFICRPDHKPWHRRWAIAMGPLLFATGWAIAVIVVLFRPRKLIEWLFR